MLRRTFLSMLSLLAARPASAAADSHAALWRSLERGGMVVLLRHAATDPGIGDPPGFDLAHCTTQRNLSDAGRDDARRIGAAFRHHRISLGPVLSSRWCRCIDTAQLAFGRVQAAPMIDSMFRDTDADRQRKLDEVRAFLAAYKAKGNLVFVTHDVNIRALIGQYVEQGDMVVASIRPGGALKLEGTIPVATVRQSLDQAAL